MDLHGRKPSGDRALRGCPRAVICSRCEAAGCHRWRACRTDVEASSTASTSRSPPTARTATGRSRARCRVRRPTSTRLHALRRYPGDAVPWAWSPSTRTSSSWCGCSAPGPGCCSPTSPPRPSGRWPGRWWTSSTSRSPTTTTTRSPAGDLGIVADLGMAPMDMGALLDDFDLYPDEMLRDIAGAARVRRQFDDAGRLSLRRDRAGGATWDAAMRARADRGRARRWPPATYRSGRSCSTRRCGDRPRPQRARGRRTTRPRTPRSSRCARPRAARGEWRLDRLHAGRHARAVHDVRRRDRAGPAGPAGLRRRTTRRPARSARCGTWSGTGGSTTGPRSSAACWPRSAAALLRDFFAAPARPLISPARTSGSLSGGGVSERPKEHASKACEGQPLRGFKSLRHRQRASTRRGPERQRVPRNRGTLSSFPWPPPARPRVAGPTSPGACEAPGHLSGLHGRPTDPWRGRPS